MNRKKIFLSGIIVVILLSSISAFAESTTLKLTKEQEVEDIKKSNNWDNIVWSEKFQLSPKSLEVYNNSLDADLIYYEIEHQINLLLFLKENNIINQKEIVKYYDQIVKNYDIIYVSEKVRPKSFVSYLVEDDLIEDDLIEDDFIENPTYNIDDKIKELEGLKEDLGIKDILEKDKERNHKQKEIKKKQTKEIEGILENNLKKKEEFLKYKAKREKRKKSVNYLFMIYFSTFLLIIIFIFKNKKELAIATLLIPVVLTMMVVIF